MHAKEASTAAGACFLQCKMCDLVVRRTSTERHSGDSNACDSGETKHTCYNFCVLRNCKDFSVLLNHAFRSEDVGMWVPRQRRRKSDDASYFESLLIPYQRFQWQSAIADASRWMLTAML